ncbi:MAG: TerD family protein [Ignavibacteria bacterium]|nr:TerD family protein [Ignavibacteria bacterium]
MAINLEKKQKINLSKAKPGLQNVFVGLGWDTKNDGGPDIDCDVAVLMLGENGKFPDDEYFVFYNNKTSPDGAVIHSGDNRTGAGEGDDEAIHIDLNRVSSKVVQIIFCVVIHEAEEKGLSFDQVENSFIRVVDRNSNSEICRYVLSEQFRGYDTVSVGRLYRFGSEWEFEALDQPYKGGLQTLVDAFI